MVYAISGVVLAKFLALGAGRGLLGLPVNDEYGLAGKRRQDFEGGTLEYAPCDADAKLIEKDDHMRPETTMEDLAAAAFAGQHETYLNCSGPDQIVEKIKGCYLSLWQARAMNALLGVALGWVVFVWSRRLFGWRGGLVSLALYCFCPTLLAHGSLATSDAAAALFFSLAVAGVWTVLHRVTPWTLLGSSLAVGCLFLTKCSAALLLPMAGLLVLIRLTRKRRLPVGWAGETYRIEGRAETRALVRAILAVLYRPRRAFGPRSRRAFLLRFWEQHTCPETAALLGSNGAATLASTRETAMTVRESLASWA